jgi:ABC-type phosphate transport system substrate-binding protein
MQVAALTALMAAASAASAEVVVVVNPASAAATMTTDQVADIYLGKSTAMKPVDLAESSAVRGEFYQKVTQKDAAQVKAIWSRLIFTGKSIPPKEAASSADVKKLVAATPDGIGYIEKSEVDGSVKPVLTVN